MVFEVSPILRYDSASHLITQWPLHRTNATRSERGDAACMLQFIYISKIGETNLQS